MLVSSSPAARLKERAEVLISLRILSKMPQCLWSNLYGIIFSGLMHWCVFPKVMWWQLLRGRLMLFPLPGGLITWSHNYRPCQHNHPGEIGRLCQQQTRETAGETQRDWREEKLALCILSNYHYIILQLSLSFCVPVHVYSFLVWVNMDKPRFLTLLAK